MFALLLLSTTQNSNGEYIMLDTNSDAPPVYILFIIKANIFTLNIAYIQIISKECTRGRLYHPISPSLIESYPVVFALSDTR